MKQAEPQKIITIASQKARIRELEHAQDLLNRSNKQDNSKVKKLHTVGELVKMKKAEKVMSEADETWIKLQIQGILDGKESMLGPYDDIDDVWKGQSCFVVGASTGLKNAMAEGFNFDMLKGFRTIVANHVVEDYQCADWLVALDERFFKLCRINIKEYKGKIFTWTKAKQERTGNIIMAYPRVSDPTEHIIDGLYHFTSSGVTAIHLAIISGANPIYLMGLDNGGKVDGSTPTYYKEGYDPCGHDTQEAIDAGKKNTAGWMKYKGRVIEKCKGFAKYATYIDADKSRKDRIFNVDPLGDMDTFKKISVRDIPELKEKFT